MSFMVAKEYQKRPLEVYRTWESTEVLIAFGIMMNEMSIQQWNDYQSSLNPDRKMPAPEAKFIVPFKTLEMIEYEMKKNKGAD